MFVINKDIMVVIKAKRAWVRIPGRASVIGFFYEILGSSSELGFVPA